MTNAGLFYHDIKHLIKNKSTQIMVNKSRSPLTQIKKNNKQYTVRDVMRADRTMGFQNITDQPLKWILHEVDNDIL